MHPATKPTRSRPLLTLALAMSFLAPARAAAAESVPMTPATMMQHCMEMQQQMQQMATARKAQDAVLAEQIAKVNSAPDGQKVALLTSTVTLLYEQRMAMDARVARMGDEMTRHMMQHMQMGRESMSGCPMMKGMAGMDGVVEKDTDRGPVHK
jgi:hypothetical protein